MVNPTTFFNVLWVIGILIGLAGIVLFVKSFKSLKGELRKSMLFIFLCVFFLIAYGSVIGFSLTQRDPSVSGWVINAGGYDLAISNIFVSLAFNCLNPNIKNKPAIIDGIVVARVQFIVASTFEYPKIHPINPMFIIKITNPIAIFVKALDNSPFIVLAE